MLKKIINTSLPTMKQKSLSILTYTLLYYSSFYFSINNRSLFFLTIIYCLLIYKIIKNLSLSILLTFIATLPFPKGRALELILLPKEYIPHWALYSIKYFFPLYLSDLFLALIIYFYIRNKYIFRSFEKKSFATNIYKKQVKKFILPQFIFLSLIILNTIGIIQSPFPEVVILSSLQMLRMFIIFSIPLIVYKLFSKSLVDKTLTLISCIIIAVLIFESGWTILQRIRGGPLGKDIEVYLPGSYFGILSNENRDLLRNTGTFFEPSILGTFLIMQISVLLILIIQKKGFDELKLPSAIAISLGIVALVFTGSRILYGILIFTLFSFFRFFFKRKLISLPNQFINKSKKLLFILIFLFTFALLSILPYLANRLLTLSEAFSPQGTATYRINMIYYSLRIFTENPILGVGLNLSPYFLASGFLGEKYAFDPTYPHNLISQLLVETGIIGTILFFVLITLIIKQILTNKDKNITKGFALASLSYFICAQFYPIFLNHTELSSFFFLYAGLSFLKLK